MIIKLGTNTSDPSINMLQVCFWWVKRVEKEQSVYQLTFPGGTVLDLTADQSAAFDQFLNRASQSARIQPANAIIAPY